MNGILSMVCPPGAGCPFDAFGLSHILLWVLTFAVVYGILAKTAIFGKSRAPAALISIIVGFLVLMAVPATLLTVLATLSTSLVTLAIGALLLISLIEVAKVGGKDSTWHGHEKWVAIVLVALIAMVFVGSGGLALIGISALPVISMGTWLIIVVGAAVLWMLSEKSV